MASSVPAGTVTPLENVNGRNATRPEDSGKTRRANQCLISGVLEKELNEPKVMPSSRWVSRMKLSILCILSIPSFVQPSSLTTASTSCRRGSIYSGWARRRYNTCVIVYPHSMSRIEHNVETKYHHLPKRSNVWLQNSSRAFAVPSFRQKYPLSG